MIEFDSARAARIPDGSYADIALACVESARRRVWVSVFIFDVRPSRDPAGRALDLATALIDRHQAGVDVRVLLAGDVTTPDIAVANIATGLLLDERGVRQRRLFGSGDAARRGSHGKFAVIDDLAVAGGHNWADDAFRLNIEDSVLLSDEPVEQLAGEFLRLWSYGRALPRDGAD
jgi:phosphatidylserine/phosphatidylglycerophosphate/cardiolipin synthase-like enzyme